MGVVLLKGFHQHTFQYTHEAFLANILLLRMTGITNASISSCEPAWYLSSMALSCIIIYPAIKYKISNIFIFLTAITILLLYLYIQGGAIEKSHYSEWVILTYGGNIRVFSEMLLAASITPILKPNSNTNTSSAYLLIKIALMTSISLFLIFPHGKTDWICLLLIFCYLVLLFKNPPRINSLFYQEKTLKCCILLGKASLFVYLCHFPAMQIVNTIYRKLGFSDFRPIAYMLVTILYSFAVYFSAGYVKRIFSKTTSEKSVSASVKQS